MFVSTPSLKIKESMHFQATVTCLSQMKAIKVIQEKLNSTQMERFRDTCFGHLLCMPKLKFCGNVVHNLLLREIGGPCINDDGMQFLVGGHVIQFRAQDFSFVTGLSLKTRPSIEKHPLFLSHRLQYKYFFGSKSISMYTLEETFINCEHEDDTVKLALVYLLEFLLLGKDKKTYVDLRFLQIVDDLDEFNMYPWGLVSYERTFSSLAIALRRRAEKFKEKKRTNPNHCHETYSLRGFPFAFQVWAYENIPKLGEAFAKRIDHVKYCPPILRWMCETAPAYAAVQAEVFNCNELDVLSPVPISCMKTQRYCKIKMEKNDENDESDPMEELEDNSDHHDAYAEEAYQEEYDQKPPKRVKGSKDTPSELKELREELKEVRQLLQMREMEIIELRELVTTQQQTLYSHMLESRTEFRKLRAAKRGGRGRG
ncbi:hypothetical protein MKW94_026546 [Papaver nudicaule]|uniref:DUF1985 domain-containing protein n=1 Tax=Papaver nudicaule TaxID=74823 RepID=A0AA41SEF9_PAPNU|nr:hypothetical protein [Papaver nudicaule]